jgi:hypothetical protein
MLLPLQPYEQKQRLNEQELTRYPPRYRKPERYLVWDGQLERFMSDRAYKQRAPWDFDIPDGWYLSHELISSDDPNRPPNPSRPAEGSIREWFIVNEYSPQDARPEGAD